MHINLPWNLHNKYLYMFLHLKNNRDKLGTTKRLIHWQVTLYEPTFFVSEVSNQKL